MGDAFDVLALEPAFDLDVSELERRYRELQKQLHPDKFAQASASEKRVSLARAVDVNQAYRSLRDPLRRAELVLARFGGSGASEPSDPELLMEVMELREELAEAKAAHNVPGVEALAKDVESREQATSSALRAAFARLQQGPSPEALVNAQGALARLRYYRRFRDEVARFEEDHAE